MRRRLTCLLGVLAALAPAAARGSAGPAPVQIVQAQQTAGPLDLAAVTFAQVHGQLELTIVTRGEWTPGELTPVRHRRLCLRLTQAPADPVIACLARLGGGRRDGVGVRIGGRLTAVAATRPNLRSIVLRIDPAVLGLAPGRLRWQVTSAWTDAAVGCPATSACHSTLPAAGSATYRLAPTAAIGCRRTGRALASSGSRSRRTVALTFDDGPWPDTPAFVSVLERERVPATFFMIGSQVGGHGALLRRELGDGDALGNHTFTHPLLTRTGDAASQLSRTTAAIVKASGYRPCVFRAPYGGQNAAVVDTALAQVMTTVLWDVDPRDYTRPGTDAIVARVLGAVRNGSIVLMHDGGGPRGQTLAALPRIIDALRGRGYRFATVPELLGYPTLYA